MRHNSYLYAVIYHLIDELIPVFHHKLKPLGLCDEFGILLLFVAEYKIKGVAEILRLDKTPKRQHIAEYRSEGLFVSLFLIIINDKIGQLDDSLKCAELRERTYL